MPTISVERWERQYTPFFPKGYADEMYRYYFPLVNGYSLRNFISGKVYQRVTTNMRIARLIENSTDYCPSTRRTRILPYGVKYVFDIYNKAKYVRKGKSYTFQFRFSFWFPYGWFLPRNVPQQIHKMFYPITNDLFHRINVGADLDATQVEYTVGVVSADKHALFENRTVAYVIITKVEATVVNQYIYAFEMLYNYGLRNLIIPYYVDMCLLKIRRAVACRTGRDMYDLYNASYREISGTDYPRERYFNIRDHCTKTWDIYRPTTILLCDTVYGCE